MTKKEYCTIHEVEAVYSTGLIGIFIHGFEQGNELGLLGKPCPVCGYKYGHSWVKEDIPEEVLQWLYDLPRNKTSYAWI